MAYIWHADLTVRTDGCRHPHTHSPPHPLTPTPTHSLQDCASYGRLINTFHHRRVTQLLKSGGRLVHGGAADESALFIEPTIVEMAATVSHTTKHCCSSYRACTYCQLCCRRELAHSRLELAAILWRRHTQCTVRQVTTDGRAGY